MKLVYLEKPKELDRFTLDRNEFLQSFIWGEILISENNNIIRLGVLADYNLVAVATLIKKPIYATYFYWYSPRGPIGDQAAIEFLIQEVKKINQKALFFRLEPRKKISAQKTIDIQPRQTLVLDLTKAKETLLREMHQKTRYNIRLAEKKGVRLEEGKVADLEEFWRLMALTGRRDNFRLHPKSHYRNLLEHSQGFVRLFFVKYQDKNIAAGLFSFWGNKVTYLHGASDNKFRNVMAPYYLQWQLIVLAKEEGFKYYDFFGIDEKKWPGVTRFKKGFAGQEIEYPGTLDFVFKPLAYFIYNILRYFKRLF